MDNALQSGAHGAHIGMLLSLLIPCLGGVVISVMGAFAPSDKLMTLNKWIGAKTATGARIACWVGLVACSLMSLLLAIAIFTT